MKCHNVAAVTLFQEANALVLTQCIIIALKSDHYLPACMQ